MARKVRKNPELLILNPNEETKASTWRKLRKVYGVKKAAAAYDEIYPKKKIKRNRDETFDMDDFPYRDHPEYKKASKLVKDFHGTEVDKIVAVDMPELGDSDEPVFLAVLGEAPADSYLAETVIPESSKGESIYVHPYEADDGKRPLKAVTADGQTILTLPVGADFKRSKHRVKKSPGDKEAWIHD